MSRSYHLHRRPFKTVTKWPSSSSFMFFSLRQSSSTTIIHSSTCFVVMVHRHICPFTYTFYLSSLCSRLYFFVCFCLFACAEAQSQIKPALVCTTETSSTSWETWYSAVMRIIPRNFVAYKYDLTLVYSSFHTFPPNHKQFGLIPFSFPRSRDLMSL